MVVDTYKILHICSEIVLAERTLNDAVDKLLVELGVTREEVVDNE
jgi:hypothetical protein